VQLYSATAATPTTRDQANYEHCRIMLINVPDTVNVKLLETLPARLTAVQTYSPLSDTDKFVKLNLDADTICTQFTHAAERLKQHTCTVLH